LTFETNEQFQEFIGRYLEDTNQVVNLGEEIIDYIKEETSLLSDNRYIIDVSDDTIDIYFNELVDSLKIVSINFFEGRIIGYKMEDWMSNMFLQSMYSNRDMMEMNRAEVKKELSKPDWYKWIGKKKKFTQESLDTANNALRLIYDYITFISHRDVYVFELTSDIHNLLNQSNKFPFLRFSKEFEVFQYPVKGELA
jgi:hypothetical protein